MAVPLSEYERIRDMGTARQAEAVDALVAEGGNFTATARRLGIARPSLNDRLYGLQRAAARQGVAPVHGVDHQTMPGFTAKRVSTMERNEAGDPQWVIQEPDKEKMLALIQETIAAISESIPRAKAQAKMKGATLAELANLYIITDYHLGMKSWRDETGEDWDMAIAEDLIYRWFERAIDLAPPSWLAVFAQLGDFTHFDSLEAVTPTSHNLLDADTRAQKMARVAIRIYRRIIKKLLTKYEHVHVIAADANHDPMSSIWCREWLHAHYEDEPRVTVDLAADGYYCYEHGSTSLFFHHGHKRKPSNVDDVFVSKFREVFGRTKHSYGHMGHLHHLETKETNLMIIEQHRTLAAPDAYASRGGWMSGRDAKVITYHKDWGEVSRLTISPEAVSG